MLIEVEIFYLSNSILIAMKVLILSLMLSNGKSTKIDQGCPQAQRKEISHSLTLCMLTQAFQCWANSQGRISCHVGHRLTSSEHQKAR